MLSSFLLIIILCDLYFYFCVFFIDDFEIAIIANIVIRISNMLYIVIYYKIDFNYYIPMNYHYFFHITTPNTSYHYYMRFNIVKDIESFKNLIFS